MDFGNILGNGQDRPPAPEVASIEDVEQYNMEWARKHGVVDTDTADRNPEQSGYAKAHEESLGRNVKQRAEFPWLHDPSRGVRWDFDPIALRNLAQENTWVGMLVQTITKEIGETPWTIVESGDRVETQKRLSTHPEERDPTAKDLPDATAERIYDLLMDPNPDAGWHDLVEMWMGDLLEIGSLSAVKAFPRRAYGGDDGDTLVADAEAIRPRAIQTSAPEVWTKDYHEKTGIVDGYWQFDHHGSPGSGDTGGHTTGRRGVQTPTFFDTDEMVWSDMTPRSNRRYGMPPTLLVEDFLQSLDLAVTQEQQYLSRGSIPSGAWVFEQWDRQEVKEWKEENAENVKGKPHKSLMFAGRGGDVRFEAMSMNFQELEFTERMKWYARVVASVFQVPTAVVGIEPERVNYNTFQGERENFESNTLGPYLQKLERIINGQIIKPHWGRDYHFEFKPGMSESTRGMISERVRAEFDRNLRTRNEARRELGLDPVDEGQEGFKDEVVEEDASGPFDDLEMSVSTGDGTSVRKDEPLRETDEWYQFDVQPEAIEELQAAIADDVERLYEAVLDDESIQQAIERLADSEGDDATDGSGETAKSLSALSRRLKDLLSGLDIADSIADAIREQTADEMADAVEESLQEADADAADEDAIDVQAIRGRLRDRDIGFANEFADRMAEDIRDTVGDGWAEGKNSREIAQDIAEQGDIKEGWDGAEKIARQELQIATGEARQAVAAEMDKVEVWQTSGDDRVRDAHQAMQGTWKRPGEEWVVEYPDRGTQKESVPGDSEPGIGCRCTTLLRDIGEVDQSDHAGAD